MYIRIKFILLMFACLAATACRPDMTVRMLTGKWNYVKVENPYSTNPPDTVTSAELKANKPYIQLSQNGDLLMMWGGKVLSHGKYKIDKQNISYTEALPDGKIRTFPFWIKKITAKEIVFETKEDDAVRITAIKE